MAKEANRARIRIDIGMVANSMEFAIDELINVSDTKILQLDTASVLAARIYP
jgi:hypothetical protein